MSPPEEQKEAFERFQQPNKLYLAKGKRLLTVLSRDRSEELLGCLAKFIRTVDGTMKH